MASNHKKMRVKSTIKWVGLVVLICLASELILHKIVPGFYGYFADTLEWDNTLVQKWPEPFQIVSIQSSHDATIQKAYYHKSGASNKPLLVSLHTWSSDYRQTDPLADLAIQNNWNYIHPDFRGPNWKEEACLSDQVIADLDDAIQFALDQKHIDPQKIFVVGVSGGAYAALGLYLKSRHSIRSFQAWVPITDLVAMHYQAKNRQLIYADHILKCTGSVTVLDENKARQRSPLFWDIPDTPPGKLEIFAGINDGYTGSVPISHSLLFYNRLAKFYGFSDQLINDYEIQKLLTKTINTNDHRKNIADRKVHFFKETPAVSVTIFDGGHEMLPDYSIDRLIEITAAK